MIGVGIELPWTGFGLDWSGEGSMLAVSSLRTAAPNQLALYSYSTTDAKLAQVELLDLEAAATRVKWIPKGGSRELLAISGIGLVLYQRQSNGLQIIQRLNANNGPTPSRKSTTAPITSFDWNRHDSNFILTASYDTTCTVWNVETGSVLTQLIAHDKQVYDVSWAPHSTNIFVSVGADGSLRLFDTRYYPIHYLILKEFGS